MKSKSILLAAAFTALTTAFAGAYAADPQYPQGKAAAKTEKEKARKPVKPHSHAEEKLGIPMPAPSGKSEMSHKQPHEVKHEHTMDRH